MDRAPAQASAKPVLLTGIGEQFANPPESDRGNAGNMVHARAARRILANWRSAPARRWTGEEVEQFRAEASHLVIVMANAVKVNQMATGFEPALAILADNIRAAKLPVIVLGLGAQAQDDRIPDDLHVSDGTRAFLDCLAGHGAAIAVRGEFTAAILHRLGLRNVTVTGCQSCVMSCDPGFADRIAVPQTTTPDRIAGSTSFVGREANLLGMMMAHGIDMIGQTEFYEYRLAHDLPTDHLADTIGVRQAITACKTLGISVDAYTAYLKAHFHQFEDLDTWATALDGYDFAFGTRFHGNMWALQCGVPALWVAHDSRTRELCRHLGLPWVAPDAITADADPACLLEHCDYSAFRRRYGEVYAGFKSFLDDVGIAHRL